MSEILFVIGWLIFLAGIAKRVERKEERESRLEFLKRERKEAKFWGLSTELEDKSYEREIYEQRNWKRNLGFESTCWSMHIGGGLVIAMAIWLGEKTLADWGKMASAFLAGGVVAWLYYAILKKTRKIKCRD